MYSYDRRGSKFRHWTRKERAKELGRLMDYAMDLEADGDSLPPKIQHLMDLNRDLTEKEEDILIEWSYSNTPGYY